MNDTTLTMVGTLVDDPELKLVPSGAAVTKFRIANTPRKFDKDTSQWVDLKDQTLFMSCSIWRQAAEALAEGLRKGDRVVVIGRLRQRSYVNRDGVNVTVMELEADEVAASLKFNTVTVNRTKRTNSGAPQGGGDADPWATANASTGRQPAGFDDSPPF